MPYRNTKMACDPIRVGRKTKKKKINREEDTGTFVSILLVESAVGLSVLRTTCPDEAGATVRGSLNRPAYEQYSFQWDEQIRGASEAALVSGEALEGRQDGGVFFSLMESFGHLGWYFQRCTTALQAAANIAEHFGPAVRPVCAVRWTEETQQIIDSVVHSDRLETIWFRF